MRGAPDLHFTKNADEVTAAVAAVEANYDDALNALVRKSEAYVTGGGFPVPFNFAFGKLADADGHAALKSAEVTLPALISGDAAARAASSAAKKQLQAMWSSAYARADVYAALKAAASSAEGYEEERFVAVTLAKFRNAGAALATEAERAELSRLDAKAFALSSTIEQNINEDTSSVTLSDAELAGCQADFIASLPGTPEARECSLKAPVLVPIMRRATSAATRKKMAEASGKKCVEINAPLLDDLIATRHAAAVALGFGSHAERMLALKMAKTAERAKGFCEDLAERVAPLRDAEMGRLLARKAAEDAETGKRKRDETTVIEPWDVAYFSDLLKREELAFDDEKVKEFFPLETTIDGLLETYSTMLGLSFERSAELPRWHEEVSAFVVKRGADVVGHLYLDQFPREGKFGHQMVVPLAPSYVDSKNGVRCVPAACNISNLPRPLGDAPALLRWGEMRTLFHELGHAMHCLCTSTKFSGLSFAWPMVPWPGGVEQDFLEVPSMALEKFAAEPELVERVARHFSGAADAPTLGADTLAKIKEVDSWMAGIEESKFFAMALADLILHSSAPPYAYDGAEGLGVAALHRAVLEKHTSVKSLPDSHACCSWYHLVLGYDAGYYSYRWSDVYAADVFEAMLSSEAGALSAATGAKLRDAILAPMATKAGDEMLRDFLGRAPTPDAWCKRKGVPSP